MFYDILKGKNAFLDYKDYRLKQLQKQTEKSQKIRICLLSIEFVHCLGENFLISCPLLFR